LKQRHKKTIWQILNRRIENTFDISYGIDYRVKIIKIKKMPTGFKLFIKRNYTIDFKNFGVCKFVVRIESITIY
jgi:hypothetical protein